MLRARPRIHITSRYQPGREVTAVGFVSGELAGRASGPSHGEPSAGGCLEGTLQPKVRPVLRLTNDQAVRAFLAAQGFNDRPPNGAVTARHFRRVVDRVTLLQIDSVNVVTRAHYVPLFARLGPYDRDDLDHHIYGRRAMFEYWCHEQSYAPIHLYPAMITRMRALEAKPWRRVRRLLEEQPGYLDLVLEEVAAHGPMSARELSDPGTRTGPWWGHGKGKIALDYLFSAGKLAIARRMNFERFYDLPERVIPASVLAQPALSERDAMRERLRHSIKSLAVATAADLCDYFRTTQKEAGPVIDAMVAKGELVPIEVEGWNRPAYTHPHLSIPRSVGGRSLVAPFDSMVWDRRRTERLFGFHYRIEIYVPAPQRKYGYYVFPFRLGEQIVARVDLKADRAAGALRVLGAFSEDGLDRKHVARELRDELDRIAEWLALDRVVLGRRGDLMAELRVAS